MTIPDTVELVGESVGTMREYDDDEDEDDEEEDAADGDEEDDHRAEDPLIRSLRRRFQDFPLHHLYNFFHQLHPGSDSMDEKDISQMVEDTINQSGNSKSTDSFGMTPLHILASSTCPD